MPKKRLPGNEPHRMNLLTFYFHWRDQKMMTKLAGKNGTTNKPKFLPTRRSQLIGTSLLCRDMVFPSASSQEHLISQVVPSPLTCSFSNTSLTHKPSKESQPISSHNLSLTRSLSPHPGLALWESHIPTQTQATSSSLLDRMALYVVLLLLILGARIFGSKSRMKTGHLS